MKTRSKNSKSAGRPAKAARKPVKKTTASKVTKGRDKPVQKKVKAIAKTTAQTMPVMASGETVVSPETVEPTSPRKGWFRRFSGAKNRKPRLLWIGDAVVPTGFATVTHAVLDHLRHDWEVVVSGVNYDGSAHNLPYQVMPAWQGGDMWGLNRFQHLCAEFDPAAVVINNDWWNVAQFVRLAPAGLPVIGYMPVDGGNLDPAAMRDLNQLHAAVWYTRYGHQEAVKAGFSGTRQVIPHGIDTDVFYPTDRQTVQQLLGLNVPVDAFIIGNINRNQPRKRLDLTIQIFADWIKQHGIRDALLLLHCAENDTGWNLRRVAAFHGVEDRLLFTGGADMRGMEDAARMRLIYNSLDVQMTTTLGEGWGLTTMEGMACGIPQIVPNSSALSEWAVPAVKIPCSRMLMNSEINTTGALVDDAPFVAALQSLYASKARRARLARQGVAHARQAAYDWRRIAAQFHAILAPVAQAKTRCRLMHA